MLLHKLLLTLMTGWVATAISVANERTALPPDQPQEALAPLPFDPSVRYGHLPNGLTYYLKHNDLPAHHAEFYLAYRVGSVLEEEDERGLAHFLEHIAFNGTQHFPSHSLLDYLERHGVKYGTNVNAYTSLDETVFNISDVPTDGVAHTGIIDSCLLMLHDWSGALSLDDDEIDKERGVIHEEWRSHRSATLRIYEKVLPQLLPQNRYAERLPIGKMEVVDYFPPARLRAFYQKWYRPELGAVFIVGDIDPIEIEGKLTELWSDLHNPADAPARTYYDVADNDSPLVAVATDPEQSYNVLSVLYKYPAPSREVKLSSVGFADNLIRALYASILNQRFDEMAHAAQAPFIGASLQFGKYLVTQTEECAELSVAFRDGEWEKGLNAALSVLHSAAAYGVTEGELARVKANLYSHYETAYNERDKRKNKPIVSEMVRHFLDDEPMPGIETEWPLVQQIVPLITKGTIDHFAASIPTDHNVALMVMGQQKDGNVMPSEAQLLTAFREATASETTPYTDSLQNATLMVEPSYGSGCIQKEEESLWDAKVWTLSNGIHVVWKQTTFKQDEVLFSAYSPGGTRLDLSQSNATRYTMGTLLSLGGLGDYSQPNLRKILAGNTASLSTYIDDYDEGLNGQAAPRDLRTLFQLIYLRFTASRRDDDAYEAWRAASEDQLLKIQDTPQKTLSDSLCGLYYPHRRDMHPLEARDLRDLDYARTFALGQQRFANPADFTFYFVGNFSEDSLRIFTEKYLAALPTTPQMERRPEEVLPTEGSREQRFSLPMEQPNTTALCNYLLYNQPYSLQAALTASLLGQAMQIVFTNAIREEGGASYSPHVSAYLEEQTGLFSFTYRFETGAEKLDFAERAAEKEMQKVLIEGMPDDTFQKVADYLRKRHVENLKENGYWLRQLKRWIEFGLNNVDNYEGILSSLEAEDTRLLLSTLYSPEVTRLKMVAQGVEKK